MLIGEVSAVTGIDTQTIRFYERQGLLPVPGRAPNGYRNYDAAVVSRLKFVRAAQAAGLTLADITGILVLRDAGEAPCAHVSGLLAERLADVRARQRELAALETEIAHLISLSQELDPADCSDAAICHIIAAPHTSEEGTDDGGTSRRRPSPFS